MHQIGNYGKRTVKSNPVKTILKIIIDSTHFCCFSSLLQGSDKCIPECQTHVCAIKDWIKYAVVNMVQSNECMLSMTTDFIQSGNSEGLIGRPDVPQSTNHIILIAYSNADTFSDRATLRLLYCYCCNSNECIFFVNLHRNSSTTGCSCILVIYKGYEIL